MVTIYSLINPKQIHILFTQHTMTRFFFIFLLLPLFSIAQTPVEQVDQLMADAKYREALTLIQELERDISPSEKPTAWEAVFQGEVWRMVHGKKHVYYQLNMSNAEKDAPGRMQALPTISANNEHGDWQFLIVCVELKSGKIAWSRSINGLVNILVDPKSDKLYVYRERTFVIDPATGEILSEFAETGKMREKGDTEAPVWKGNRSFSVTNSTWEPDAVVQMESDTKERGWSFRYPHGKYSSTQHPMRGGSYPEKWLPLTAIDDYLLALDDHGNVSFLDPHTGAPMASIRFAKDYLAMPFQYKHQLIVPSYHGIRSYSMTDLIEPDSSLYSKLKLQQASCLFNLEQYQEALLLLDTLIEQAPHLSHTWLKRSQACMALGLTAEEFWSYSHYLSLSGNSTDYNLYNKWGVLRQYHLKGKLAWSVVSAGEHIYAGSLNGDLWAIQQSDLSLDLVSPLNRKIRAIHEGTALRFWPNLPANKGREIIPTAQPQINHRIGKAWFTTGGAQRISLPYAYRGKQYRTTFNGGVLILEDTQMLNLPPLMKDIGTWKIHFGSTEPLGYGKGVYELDENLRPIRLLIKPKLKGTVEIVYIQTFAQSIGVIVNSYEGAFMQVYSRDGHLLNEAPLGRFISLRAEAKAFISVGNGYLFSDRQLTWLSAAHPRKTWKLGPSLARTQGSRVGDRWRYFGNPLLEKGCVYVTDRVGHVYVIDAKRITGDIP